MMCLSYVSTLQAQFLAHGNRMNTGTTLRSEIAITEYISGHTKRRLNITSGPVKYSPFFAKLRTVVHIHVLVHGRTKDIVAKYLCLFAAFCCAWAACWSSHGSKQKEKNRNIQQFQFHYHPFLLTVVVKTAFLFGFQMMADLMFRKNEYDSATFHFQQLLERKPGIVCDTLPLYPLSFLYCNAKK